MRAFFHDQKTKAGKEARKVTNSFKEQHKKFTSDVNSRVESVKESGRKVADMCSYLPNDDSESRLENPDVNLSVPSIIARHGYLCETHTVVSQGYILNVHRIPHGKNSKDIPSKTVYFQHGLLASSADWVLNGPEKALAYVLADAGYDVWMGNVRGNKYSREHAWFKPSSKAYWNFSWHDVAEHDVPAVIDYILKVKGAETKIAYIGHSMGTTILFAMLTTRPEYNDILYAGIALAPVVYVSDIKSPVIAFAPIISNVASMEMMCGNYEFVPKLSYLSKIMCACEGDKMDVSKTIIFYICGSNEHQLDKALLPVFLANIGSGTSWKTTIHYAQEFNSGGNFQKFDYGSNNKRIYGTDKPPLYDLSKVTLPITLIWAKNDLLSSEKDVQKLIDSLPPTTDSYMVPHPHFNHLDYLWAKDAPLLLNDRILRTLEKLQ